MSDQPKPEIPPDVLRKAADGILRLNGRDPSRHVASYLVDEAKREAHACLEAAGWAEMIETCIAQSVAAELRERLAAAQAECERLRTALALSESQDKDYAATAIRNQRLREALRIYADRANWHHSNPPAKTEMLFVPPEPMRGGYELAEAALGKKGKGSDD